MNKNTALAGSLPLEQDDRKTKLWEVAEKEEVKRPGSRIVFKAPR
jgi:hypothetical protein